MVFLFKFLPKFKIKYNKNKHSPPQIKNKQMCSVHVERSSNFIYKKILGKKGADYGDSYYDDDDDDAYGGSQLVPVPVPMLIPHPPGPRITGPGMPAGKNNAPNEIDRIPCGRWRCCTGADYVDYCTCHYCERDKDCCDPQKRTCKFIVLFCIGFLTSNSHCAQKFNCTVLCE
jgi:hypothetical protein